VRNEARSKENGLRGLEVPSHRILEAWSTFQVAIECIRYVEDTLYVLHAQRLFVVYCERLGGADCVLDLIHPVSRILWQNIEGEREHTCRPFKLCLASAL
jgi:hypothetical protein